MKTTAELMSKLNLTVESIDPNGYVKTKEPFDYVLPCGYRGYNSKNLTLVVNKKAVIINGIAV